MVNHDYLCSSAWLIYKWYKCPCLHIMYIYLFVATKFIDRYVYVCSLRVSEINVEEEGGRWEEREIEREGVSVYVFLHACKQQISLKWTLKMSVHDSRCGGFVVSWNSIESQKRTAWNNISAWNGVSSIHGLGSAQPALESASPAWWRCNKHFSRCPFQDSVTTVCSKS